jgi:hypothetical protein
MRPVSTSFTDGQFPSRLPREIFYADGPSWKTLHSEQRSKIFYEEKKM